MKATYNQLEKDGQDGFQYIYPLLILPSLLDAVNKSLEGFEDHSLKRCLPGELRKLS